MDRKRDRNYSMTLQGQGGEMLTILPPISLDFDVTRNLSASANTASFRVYNLSSNKRNQIRKNSFDYSNIRQITWYAGYGTNLPIAFKGIINQAWSVRNGVDFVTQIDCQDGGQGIVNGNTSAEYVAGTPYAGIIRDLVSSLPGTEVGAIGSFPNSTTRGTAYSGNTTDILGDLSSNGFFIDNNKANCLNENECLVGEISEINNASGILGTPIREVTRIIVNIIFEPRLRIGQFITLNSLTAKNLNGSYKVTQLQHKGTISPAVCGEAVTTVTLFSGTAALSLVN